MCTGRGKGDGPLCIVIHLRSAATGWARHSGVTGPATLVDPGAPQPLLVLATDLGTPVPLLRWIVTRSGSIALATDLGTPVPRLGRTLARHGSIAFATDSWTPVPRLG